MLLKAEAAKKQTARVHARAHALPKIQMFAPRGRQGSSCTSGSALSGGILHWKVCVCALLEVCVCARCVRGMCAQSGCLSQNKWIIYDGAWQGSRHSPV